MLRVMCALAGIFCVCAGSAYGQQGTQTEAPPPKSSPTSNTRERPAMFGGPQTPTDVAPALMRQTGGSLFQMARVAPANPVKDVPPEVTKSAVMRSSPFGVSEPEPKLVKKHDLVTIIVREESETSNQGTSDIKRESAVEAKITQAIGFDLANKALIPAVTGAVPTIDLSGNRNFKGEATVARSDSFTTRINAEVVDVKPNGTLVLQARKKIKNDEEEQVFICSGICRVEDITPDNSVLSTQLFDLEVTKTSKGQVKSGTKTGIVHKLLDFINLF